MNYHLRLGNGGGEDCSYGDECFEAGATSGDSTLDATLDVLDMVLFIEIILNP